MASGLIDGKACAADLEEELKSRISSCKVQPHLAVVIVGDDPASHVYVCLLYTSPSPRDRQKSRMPSSA